MATKKYYAVKKGKSTGIFRTWEECRACVEGCPGAQYKGFAALEEAEGYLGLESGAGEASRGGADGTGPRSDKSDGSRGRPSSRRGKTDGSGGRPLRQEDADDEGGGQPPEPDELNPVRGDRGFVRDGDEVPAPGTLLAYVDGSYDDSLKRYAFGCVFILPDGRIYTEYGNGDNRLSLRHRNVTGEMLGAMYAVKTAMRSGFSAVELCYDYEGIEKWVTGAWRSKTELTQKYAAAMREWKKSIRISFRKVAAHTNVYYNELADKIAKTGLREGEGIPEIRSLV